MTVNKKPFILCVGLCFLLVFTSMGQDKNDLLDRSFWKSLPNVEDIKSKVEEGHSPTDMTIFGFDATVYAILENNAIENIQYLLTQGNDVNKITHDARTYIFWAAYKGNVELMKYLISKGAKTDLVDQHGYTIPMFAAATGQTNTEVYDYCETLGFSLKDERTQDGRNALLAYAGSMKDVETIEYFILKGFDIHGKDPEGNGIFHHTAKTGNQEFLETLISTYKVNISKNESTNENAILFASRRFNRSGAENPLSFYQYLEGLGLNPTIISKNGETALLNIARNTKNIEVIKYFIEKGTDVNQVDQRGNTALINAAGKNNMDVVKLILANTQRIDHKNNEGQTAFMSAIGNNELEVAKEIFENGASIKVKDKKGFDPGYYVVESFDGNIEVFKEKFNFLIQNGYRITSKHESGTMLFHSAIAKQNTEILDYLLDKGIDINAKDNDGETALHKAAMQAKNTDILQFLIDAGANKKALTSFDESAYDLARQNEILAQQNIDIEFLKYQ